MIINPANLSQKRTQNRTGVAGYSTRIEVKSKVDVKLKTSI